MAIATISPVSGETLKTFESDSLEEVREAIDRANEAFRAFRETTFGERSALLARAADLLDQRQRSLAELITVEMGKPITASVAEVAKCALVCRYYAEHGAEYLQDETIETSAKKSFVRYEPLGIILAIMPWNFPFWQVFRFAAPALMAGNVALLKHASNVPQCALAIEKIFVDAGYPEAVFQTLLIEASDVAPVLEDPRVAAATLTGSEGAGKAVARAAASQIKKVVLELGGSDPFIVMPSADLDEAVRTGIRARIVNSGQSCIAAKRFIVHSDVADEFQRRMSEGMERLRMGDPMDEQCEVGPLATPQILKEVAAQVDQSVEAGSKLLTGGKRVGDSGNFYAPTVLTDVPENAPVYREEVFGPVATIFRISSVDEAIEIANATEFGLGSSVWTNDEAEQKAFIDGIAAGLVFVNAMVASDPRMPFGGIKHSGYGRELGLHGIREFVNVKTVWMA